MRTYADVVYFSVRVSSSYARHDLSQYALLAIVRRI